MTTHSHPRPTPRPGPFVLIGGIAVVVAGAAFGATQYDWGSGEKPAPKSTAQAAWVAGAPASPEELLQIERALHEAWTDAIFGPLKPVAPTPEELAQSAAEHDNAISGAGIFPSGESVASAGSAAYEAGLAAAIAEHDNAISGVGIVPSSDVAATTGSAEYEASLAAAIAEHDDAISGAGIVPSGEAVATTGPSDYERALAEVRAEFENLRPSLLGR